MVQHTNMYSHSLLFLIHRRLQQFDYASIAEISRLRYNRFKSVRLGALYPLLRVLMLSFFLVLTVAMLR